MGVQGLTTFMDNNLHLLSKHQLHGTKLIIDGNNLYHLLYYNYSVDVRHGGDYDKFERKSRHFFEMLQACKITPYIVFDGGYEVDDRKFNTTVERAKERINMAGIIGHDGRGKLMPILAYETFRHVLHDMEIAHCTCDFEADDQIAVLANEWNCPVMSYDSDFYIFSMRGGYVPFDSVDLTVHTAKSDDGTEYKYLACLIYFFENFNKHFPKLKNLLLPFIATLLGNDFVDVLLFKSFYRELGTPKEGSSHFSIPKYHHRMFALFKWLESLDSIEYGIQKVLTTTPQEQREQLRTSINLSMSVYSNVHQYSSINLGHILEGKVDPDYTDVPNSTCKLPLWFRIAFWKGGIAQFCQNVIMLKRVILQCQMEHLSTTSSYSCSTDIRRVIYGLLTIPDEKISEMVQSSENSNNTNILVTEYGREIKNVKKIVVEAMWQIEGFGRLPSLQDIPHMTKEDRMTLFLASLGIEKSHVAEIPKEHRLFVAVIIFWVRSAEPKVSLNQLKAVLVCFIAMATNNRFIKTDDAETQDQRSLMAALKKSSPQQLEKVTRSLEKFHTSGQKHKKQSTEMNIVHSFSQFQTCLLAAIHLNQVLLSPVEGPNPARVFCGSFLYTFSKDLDFRPNVDVYIAEVLIKKSPLLELYNFFLIKIMDETNGRFDDRFSGKKVRKRKKTAKKNSEKIATQEKSDSSENEDQNFLAVQAACEVSNRFMALHMNALE